LTDTFSAFATAK